MGLSTPAKDEEIPPASSDARSREGHLGTVAVRMLEPSLGCAGCAGSHLGLSLWEQGEPVRLSVPSPGTAALGAGVRAMGEGDTTSHGGLLPDASWPLVLHHSSPSLSPYRY